MAALLSTVLLLVLLAGRVHIGLALALTGFLGLWATGALTPALTLLGTKPFQVGSAYAFAVVPLFVLMGRLALVSGVARDAFDFAQKAVGRYPGGLASATTVASGIFAATTGSSVATASTVGGIALPAMRRHGYDDRLSSGAIAAGGTLGVLIPPSVILVVYALMTNESLGRLLVAAIIPGILSALMYIAVITIRASVSPDMAPKAAKVPFREVLKAGARTWGILVLFGAVMGSIFIGLATPTEAAALGALASLALTALSGSLTWSALMEALVDTAKTVGMVGLLLVGASIYATFIAFTGVGADLALWLQELSLPPHLLLIAVLLVFVPMGMFLDSLSMILILVPLVHGPLEILGFDGALLAILTVKMVELGLMTPPVGINVYTVAGLAPDLTSTTVFRGVLWFCVADIVTVALLILFPQLTLWLPSLMNT